MVAQTFEGRGKVYYYWLGFFPLFLRSCTNYGAKVETVS